MMSELQVPAVPKRKAGRPRLGDGTRQATPVLLRVTRRLKDDLTTAASIAGMSVSEFAKQACERAIDELLTAKRQEAILATRRLDNTIKRRGPPPEN